MASSSDWIAHAAMAGTASAGGAGGAMQPGWLAALGVDADGGARGFRELSPLAFAVARAEPATPPADTAAHNVAAPSQTAEETAYARGFADGEAQAMRAGQEALAAERARYKDLRLAFRTLDSAARDALAQDLAITVRALCQQVLGEYAMDSAALTARCDEAARRLGAGPAGLTLHLHPETRAQLPPGALDDWTLADDPGLAPGALRLSGADGEVREGPEDWARALAEALQA